MKIGVSLPMDVLCDTPVTDAQRALLAPDGAGGLLGCLKSEGVTHIEIRSIRPGEAPARISAAVKAIRLAGMLVTVHGWLSEEKPEALLEAVRPVLTRQSEVMITVHPIRTGADSEANRAATVRALRRLGEAVRRDRLRVSAALENCRMAKAPDPSVSPEGVLKALRESGEEAFGACFDFGHFYSDRLARPEQVTSDLPGRDFARRVIHTHIHDLNGRTHFPLGTGSLPLDGYLALLCEAGYRGVYNLELEPERWAEQYPDVRARYIASVRTLRGALSRLPLPEDDGDLLSVFGTCSGTEPMEGRHHCSFAVTHHGRHYWFDAGECCAYTAHRMGVDLQRIRAVFISHPHMDHIGGLGNLLWTVRKLDGIYHGRQGMPLSLFMPDERTWPAQYTLLCQTEGDFRCDFPIIPARIREARFFEEDGLSVEALHNLHLPPLPDGSWRSYSFRIRVSGKTVVFTGDVKSLAEIAPLLRGADVLLAETGHHHPAAVCRELIALQTVPGHLFFIHHGRDILEGGEEPVREARAFYPGPITVLNDGDVFPLSEL